MRFSDIKGQELAVRVLKNEFLNGRQAQAYLFTGPEGTGKKSAAVAFAQLLNCLNPARDGDSCGGCSQCRKISGGNHPDFEMVTVDEDRSQIRIEQLRQLQKQAALKRLEGKKKVYIIDDANDMTRDCANSFLKTLEEPNENVVIILIARNYYALLPTIRSRCRTVRFRNIPEKDLAGLLVSAKGISMEDARRIAAFSQGRLSQALMHTDSEIQEIYKLAQEITCISSVQTGSGSVNYEGIMNVVDTVSGDRELAREVISCLVSILRDDFLKTPSDSLRRDIETVLYADSMLERNVNVAAAFTGMMLKLKVPAGRYQ